jgi:hypothetical protein
MRILDDRSPNDVPGAEEQHVCRSVEASLARELIGSQRRNVWKRRLLVNDTIQDWTQSESRAGRSFSCAAVPQVDSTVGLLCGTVGRLDTPR